MNGDEITGQGPASRLAKEARRREAIDFVPFAERLDLPAGSTFAPTQAQRALLEGFLEEERPLTIDRAELTFDARRTARRQAAARALALAALEGMEVSIIAATQEAARDLRERAEAELELACRTQRVDVEPARSRLRASIRP